MSASSSPLVSVLVPICNVERYLDQCLESARMQTLKDIEVICINDGSTDGSLDIINSYVNRDPRFKVIDKPNSGYGDSMNKGLEMASGKYVSILESDDFLDPEALESPPVCRRAGHLLGKGLHLVRSLQEVLPGPKRHSLPSHPRCVIPGHELQLQGVCLRKPRGVLFEGLPPLSPG